ncbi:RpiR family transcriptional regulator [Nocardia mexicana]|uniref:RpiR family transcriptional regulator n=1 Tax=Nocardia mexicana TaxID=279262 RepID=A0A370H9H8_9NOCA|nr:RpiR family transcriptional regulator [Nocardia mexicana]
MNAVTDQGPQTFDELVAELRARHDSLSQAHRKLSERVMADPEAVAFMTVSELAAAVGVNEATVVRFANALGLKGYPGLTRLCRERLQEQAQLLRRFDNLERLPADGGGLLNRTLGFDQANIARTFARIEDETWDRAVRHLTEAPRVHVMGLRKCHAPAYLLAYLLGMVREEVALVTATAGALTDDLRRVREGDCFVAMSIHRYMAETVRGAAWARSVGAHVVVLTDNPGSPLAATADDCFFVDATSPSVLRSMTAFTSLVQALTAGVAKSHGREARASLLQEERLLSDFHVYTTDSGR